LPLPASVWPYVLSSALAEVVYFGMLSVAYGYGEFSLVYPVARGAAPALLALWALLFLGQSPSAGGGAGLAVLASGLAVVGGSGWWEQRGQPGQGAGFGVVALALAVALVISVYSAIDGAAVQFVNPLPYTALVFELTALFAAPLMLWRYGPARLWGEWKTHPRRIALVGSLNIFSYGLVLSAYALAPVSYGGAIREVSIVFAALAGWLWLGEGLGRLRVAGALIMFCGIVIIAVAG
jgi:drug/metabolite transporter (DMT)-like permease